MPLYQHRCNKCGNIEEKFLPVERRNEVYECPIVYTDGEIKKCGGKMELIISQTSKPIIK